MASPFGDLVALWLADLELRDLALGTKESYRDNVRLHVLPAFEHFTLGEITTGRVEWFLKSEAAVSHSQAMHSRTLLNLLFGFALRHDAIARNPVEGTSQLRKPKSTPPALTVAQIAAIRRAAIVVDYFERFGDAYSRSDPGRQARTVSGRSGCLQVLTNAAVVTRVVPYRCTIIRRGGRCLSPRARHVSNCSR